MAVFPANQPRATRFEQLGGNMISLQTDLKHLGQGVDQKNSEYRPAIDALLKANGMASVDDVVDRVASQMTRNEQKVFEALINTNQKTKGVSLRPTPAVRQASVVLAGKIVISIAQWGARMVNVASLANFITAAEGGEAAAAAAASISAEAEETTEALDGVSEAAEAAEVAADVAEAASIVGSLSAFPDVLAGVGLVVGLITGALQIFEGAKQKKKLVNAIHRLQPARLTTARFDRMGASIVDQLLNLGLYIDASPGGAEPNARIAAKCAAQIIVGIGAGNSKIDVSKLESDLEAEDRKASNFYGGADF